MSGSPRSSSAMVGTNSAARARALAPVYATRASPYPIACSSEARVSAALTSSSTISKRGISCWMVRVPCARDGVSGCVTTTVRSAETHGPRVLIAGFEALDLQFGLVTGDAIDLLDLARKARTIAPNEIKVRAREPSPVCIHLNPESLPAGLHEIPVHIRPPASAVRRL